MSFTSQVPGLNLFMKFGQGLTRESRPLLQTVFPPLLAGPALELVLRLKMIVCLQGISIPVLLTAGQRD